MNNEIISPIRLSLEVSITAEIFIICLGLIIGRVMARRRKSLKKAIIETVLMMPLVLPPSVVGFILIVIFGRHSFMGYIIEWLFGRPIIFSFWAAVVAATVVAFPLMFQSTKTGIESVDKDIEDAARLDGANELNLFLLITIPLASKSIMTGAILGFARAIGEFGATLMFAGNIPLKTQTIPTAIYVAIDSGAMHVAWILVIATITISFIMLISTQLWGQTP